MVETSNHRVLHDQLQRAVTRSWRRGWQPADLVRVANRFLDAACARLLRDAITGELQQYAAATVDPRWPAQLELLGARVWWRPEQTHLEAALERAVRSGDDARSIEGDARRVMALLHALEQLEMLGSVPGEHRRPATDSEPAGEARAEVDPKVLARIRALLAKAEATTSEAEAEAFTAGAQERMARYSIDQAMLDASGGPGHKPIPGGLRIGIDNPYEPAKVALLAEVATANRCRSVWTKGYGFCTLIGFDTDLAATETLFTSLLVQASAAMNRAGRLSARARTRPFRQSFLLAYAVRIGERLTEITAQQTAQASSAPGGRNVLPVLASRDLAVQQTARELFPVLGEFRAGRVTDGAGWHTGRQAADLATLESRASVGHV